jgi:Zn-dependent protease
MDTNLLAMRVMYLVPMLLSLTVHEWAHAWSAWKLGDDTAAREGRLTLNPVAHIDPIGTLLLPLLGVPFGWAKPVPINPLRFTRKVTMGTGMAITAAAGPLSNLVLAVLCAVGIGVLYRVSPLTLARNEGVGVLLMYGIQLNVALFVFNLLPIPPLDGSRILQRVVGYRHPHAWEQFSRVAPFILFVVIATGGLFLSRPIGAVNGVLYELIGRIAKA